MTVKHVHGHERMVVDVANSRMHTTHETLVDDLEHAWHVVRVEPPAVDGKESASKDVRHTMTGENLELYTATLRTLLPVLVVRESPTTYK